MRFSIILAALAVTTGHATVKPAPTPEPVPVSQTQGQSQSQGQAQLQGQAQGQHQSAASSSTSVAAASATGSAAASSDNDVSIETPRQAPALSQGSFAIQGCAVAGNAGHSSASGGGFLGFGFTSAQCYDFMLAQAYASVGALAAACEVLNTSRAGQRAAARGVALPVCTTPIPLAAPPPVVVNVAAASAASDCKAATDAAFKQCVAK